MTRETCSHAIHMSSSDVVKKQQEELAHLVERILSAKQRNASADVSAQERELDQLAYEFYDLTMEEIEIAERASNNANS